VSVIFTFKPNRLIDHPTGGNIFGIIPEIQRLGLGQANIYLRAGVHRMAVGQPPSGFGVRHIWEGKQQELKKRGCSSADDVPVFVSQLIVIGTEIYHDPAHPRADMKRITLLRTTDGTLLLEPRSGDRNLGFHYQVITWTPRPHPKGIQVGQIDVDWAQQKRRP
jgi:hypothetical protein